MDKLGVSLSYDIYYGLLIFSDCLYGVQVRVIHEKGTTLIFYEMQAHCAADTQEVCYQLNFPIVNCLFSLSDAWF